MTLGVRDLDAARRFHAALGWHGQEVDRTVFVQAGGLVVVLWGRADLAADCGVPDGHPWEVAHDPGFRLGDDGSVLLPDLGGSRW